MIIATPPLASAQKVAYSTPPVAITSFSVNESSESSMIGREAPRFIANDITLKFVNTSEVPPTTITFLVNDGQYMRSIVDKGTFNPRVLKDRVVRLSLGYVGRAAGTAYGRDRSYFTPTGLRPPPVPGSALDPRPSKSRVLPDRRSAPRAESPASGHRPIARASNCSRRDLSSART
jgi:hypothetical protein